MKDPALNKLPECPSCGGQDPDEMLLPYCSVVCRTLGIRGLGWRTGPYRIVDQKTGVVLAMGPHLDLSPEGLGTLVVQAKSARRGHSSQLRQAAKSEQAKQSIGGPFSIPGVENIGVGGLP